MRTSPQSTLFQVFDKVIVLILAVLAVGYALLELLSPPTSGVNDKNVDDKIKIITESQMKARHAETPFARDYLGATIGGFRPDADAFVPRTGLFPPPGGARPHWPPDRVELSIDESGKPQPKSTSLPTEYTDAQFRIEDPTVVRVEIDRERLSVRLTPLNKGETVIHFTLGADRALGDTRVTVQSLKEVEARIKFLDPQKDLTAVPPTEQALAGIQWKPPEVIAAVLKEYEVWRAEGDQKEILLLRMVNPEKLESGAVLPTLDAAGKPGPDVTFDKDKTGKFTLQDATVEGDLTYAYTVVAKGVDKKTGQKALMDKAGPQSVTIQEPFKIVFRQTGGATATMIVSVLVRKSARPAAEKGAAGGAEKGAAGGAEKAPTPGAEKAPAPGAEKAPAPGAEKAPAPGAEKAPAAGAEKAPAAGAEKVAPEQEPRLEESFLVELGQPVGWKRMVKVTTATGAKLTEVDFSTGYQLLDILNKERRIRFGDQPIKDAEGNVVKDKDGNEMKRQYEEFRQRVLLINKRGRIKVLWPAEK